MSDLRTAHQPCWQNITIISVRYARSIYTVGDSLLSLLLLPSHRWNNFDPPPLRLCDVYTDSEENQEVSFFFTGPTLLHSGHLNYICQEINHLWQQQKSLTERCSDCNVMFLAITTKVVSMAHLNFSFLQQSAAAPLYKLWGFPHKNMSWWRKLHQNHHLKLINYYLKWRCLQVLYCLFNQIMLTQIKAALFKQIHEHLHWLKIKPWMHQREQVRHMPR